MAAHAPKPTPRRTAAAEHAARQLSTRQPTDYLAPGEAPPAWVPLSVASERVTLHERTIRRAIAAGELRGYRFGKALRVRLDELDAWAESKAMPDPYNGRRLVAVKGR